jgi:glucosamine--fructose-6-phosphate aminotransferase (isomerizing)
MNLTTNPYLQDILSQPEALRTALARFDETPLQALARTIHRGGFACIVLTGMGASFYAAYPVWLRMIQSGLPAYWIDTSELLHSAHALLSKHALLWVFSQSGRSAEIVALLERRDLHGVSVLATVNDLNSPLAQAAGERIIPLWAEAEYSVSTRTYLNTLALSQLAALALTGNPNPRRAERTLCRCRFNRSLPGTLAGTFTKPSRAHPPDPKVGLAGPWFFFGRRLHRGFDP